MSALERLRPILATACLLGAGLHARIGPLFEGWRVYVAEGHTRDIVTLEAGRYEPLIASLPARGTVGYLPPDDWPTEGAIRRFYEAQYALTPRVVVMDTSPEYVIVVPEASVDARLADFVPFARLENGLRVFRRVK
jgi:hypothetical protein